MEAKKIALLVPVCSRGQSYTDLSSTAFYKTLLPSFIKNCEPNYIYKFFIGYDSSDKFYTDERMAKMTNMTNMTNIINMVNMIQKNSVIMFDKKFEIKTIKLEDCEHKPAVAWNILFKAAIAEDFDYYYQIGDDVIMETLWTSAFIDVLEKNENIGVVGGCHALNYYMRYNANKPAVIENAFVHKTHYHIFGTFFENSINNWFCDDWITEIYKPNYSTHLLGVTVNNTVTDNRYNIQNIGHLIAGLIIKGKKQFVRYNLEKKKVPIT